MTTNKAQKRAIRARIAKTGERYAAARHILLDPHRRPETEPAAAPDPVMPPEPTPDQGTAAPAAAAPGMSDDAVRRATGKGWDEWFALLDAWEAAGKGHPAIARHLQEAHGLGGWWAQGVTVGYERARGLRARHEKADGFAVSVSRTFPVSAERLSAFFVDGTLRDRWLESGTLTLRTATPGRSARFDVAGGGRLGVFLTTRSPDKTTAALQHEKLPDAEAAAARRAFWKERLARLAEALAE